MGGPAGCPSSEGGLHSRPRLRQTHTGAEPGPALPQLRSAGHWKHQVLLSVYWHGSASAIQSGSAPDRAVSPVSQEEGRPAARPHLLWKAARGTPAPPKQP